jgi:hypothetical protein
VDKAGNEGTDGLDVIQAPNGVLIQGRYKANDMYYFKPDEPPSASLQVKSVFPFRGGLAGGGKIMIFGENFAAGAKVKMGDKDCTDVNVVSSKKIECTIPAGSLGDVDLAVTVNGSTKYFFKGYKYITGKP